MTPIHRVVEYSKLRVNLSFFPSQFLPTFLFVFYVFLLFIHIFLPFYHHPGLGWQHLSLDYPTSIPTHFPDNCHLPISRLSLTFLKTFDYIKDEGRTLHRVFSDCVNCRRTIVCPVMSYRTLYSHPLSSLAPAHVYMLFPHIKVWHAWESTLPDVLHPQIAK